LAVSFLWTPLMPFGHGGAGTPILLVENQVPSLWHTVQQFSLRVYCLLEVHSVAGKKDCVGEGELDISFPREASLATVPFVVGHRLRWWSDSAYGVPHYLAEDERCLAVCKGEVG
jgi:hypothetical protein